MIRIKDRSGVTREENDDYVLADGETLTFPTMFMDSRTVITDGRGNVAGQRPGYLVADRGADIAEAVRVTTYAQYDQAISERWRGDRWQEPNSSRSESPSGGDVDAAHAAYRANLENRWRT